MLILRDEKNAKKLQPELIRKQTRKDKEKMLAILGIN